MNKLLNQHDHSIDFKFLFIVIILVLVGFVMVFSASTVMAQKRFGDEFFFLKRHVIWLTLGFIAMFIGAKINYKVWQKIAFPLVILSFIFLVAVLVPGIGVSVGGARRWFRFGFLGFQPSELAKLSLVMYTASWLTRKSAVFLMQPKVYIPKLLMVGIMLLLIFKEPDLGTTVLITCVIFSMHFVGGLKKRYLLSMFLLMLPALIFAIATSAYRRRRVLAFLNPWENAQGSGYQLVQSLLAIGSGGITGVGLGASKLKLLYLPEAHTDFIYPIIAEELGLLGSLGVIFLFVLLCIRGIRISLRTDDMFGKLLSLGLTLTIIYQSIINIAVVTGMMPTKGMPLPFVSFGGSSLVVTMFSVGIILNISRGVKRQ